MQRSGFTMPILLVTPIMLLLLKVLCNNRKTDLCNFSSFLPKEVFWNCNYDETKFDFFNWKYWLNYQFLIWIIWLFPLIWLTVHLWIPEQERLARSEKL